MTALFVSSAELEPGELSHGELFRINRIEQNAIVARIRFPVVMLPRDNLRRDAFREGYALYRPDKPVTASVALRSHIPQRAG